MNAGDSETGSYEAETEGRRCCLCLCTSGPDPGGAHTLAMQHWSSSSLWKKKKKKISTLMKCQRRCTRRMQTFLPTVGTATSGHFDSHLGLPEHSPSHFREERRRPQTLTVWDSRSFCNNNHRLVFDSEMTINDSRRSGSLWRRRKRGRDLSIKTNNACLNTTKEWFK